MKLPSKDSLAGAALSKLHTHLRLARASNLPTVWSNCAAGWALAGGGVSFNLLILMIAISMLYTGGMYLNDAFDAEWDRERKIPRPIPNGEIARVTVFVFSAAWFGLGTALLNGQGRVVIWLTSLLLGCILLYDYYHKRIAWSPVLMGLCRAMIYLITGWAAWISRDRDFNIWLVMWAAGLGLYVIGLSYIARSESGPPLRGFLLPMLVFVPPFLNLADRRSVVFLGLSACFVLFVIFCMSFVTRPGTRDPRKAVSWLLAGICLVDLLAVTRAPNPLLWQIIVFGCFLITPVFQRYVPAT